jgi:thioredoxin 1
MGADMPCALVNNHRDLSEMLRTGDRLLALFYASWCPFCRKFLPVFEKHAEKDGPHFVLVQDDQETLADRYAVKVYPTVLFFENGVVSKRLDGVSGVGLEEEQLTQFADLCSRRIKGGS